VTDGSNVVLATSLSDRLPAREAFVITKDGRIAHKHIGPVTPQDLESTVLPLIKRLRQQ
jgi:peroxiredoxin